MDNTDIEIDLSKFAETGDPQFETSMTFASGERKEIVEVGDEDLEVVVDDDVDIEENEELGEMLVEEGSLTERMGGGDMQEIMLAFGNTGRSG